VHFAGPPLDDQKLMRVSQFGQRSLAAALGLLLLAPHASNHPNLLILSPNMQPEGSSLVHPGFTSFYD
jgi:hypothetical protein